MAPRTETCPGEVRLTGDKSLQDSAWAMIIPCTGLIESMSWDAKNPNYYSTRRNTKGSLCSEEASWCCYRLSSSIHVS